MGWVADFAWCVFAGTLNRCRLYGHARLRLVELLLVEFTSTVPPVSTTTTAGDCSLEVRPPFVARRRPMTSYARQVANASSAASIKWTSAPSCSIATGISSQTPLMTNAQAGGDVDSMT